MRRADAAPTIERVRLGIIVLLFLTSCASKVAIVRSKAAEDLRCEDIEVTEAEDGDGYVASGCGEEATYECHSLPNPGAPGVPGGPPYVSCTRREDREGDAHP